LLPVGGTYTLTAAEAAKACEVIGCKIAIPYHWGDIVGQASDAKTFAQRGARRVCMTRSMLILPTSSIEGLFPPISAP
ncbi:hypothetical protein LCGC14_2818810, partial [marine sediment metagenome]